MSPRRMSFLRPSRQILTTIVLASLVTWAMCAPLVWTVRDGLGPDSVDTVGTHAVFKFLGMWGIPALARAVPLFVPTRAHWGLRKPLRGASCDHDWVDRDEMLNYDPKYLRCPKCGGGSVRVDAKTATGHRRPRLTGR